MDENVTIDKYVELTQTLVDAQHRIEELEIELAEAKRILSLCSVMVNSSTIEFPNPPAALVDQLADAVLECWKNRDEQKETYLQTFGDQSS